MKAWIVEKVGVREGTLADGVAANGRAEFVWFHLNGRAEGALEWLEGREEIPDVARKALAASETRPRTEAIEQGALVNLRGLGASPEDDPDPLVSIRIWAEKGRAISVALREPLALTALCARANAGHVRDPGDLVSSLATAITDGLDPDVAALGDTLDDCELMLEERGVYRLRRRVTAARATAIGYRRFVVPQRIALERLAALDADWLHEDDRQHLREAADRAARMSEELESVRERAALMHEELTDLRAEQLDGRSLVISIAALVFLPLTFLTGLLGMNIPLPVPDDPSSFWWVVAASAVITVAIVAYFLMRRWVSR